MGLFENVLADNNLVRCKSIKRTLAQTASHVSLLIILVEQDPVPPGDGAKGDLCLSLPACCQALLASAQEFVKVCERQAHGGQKKELEKQMTSACQSLNLAIDRLFVLTQRIEFKETKDDLDQDICQAAKDVLQKILEALLVKDGFHIQRLVQKVDSLLSLLQTVPKVRERSDLITTFQEVTAAVLTLKRKLTRRCQDLCGPSCRQQLLTWLAQLRSSIPSLSQTAQTCLKYCDSEVAAVNRESVMQDIDQACNKIKQMLLFGAEDENGIPSFVSLVDQVLENLSQVQRGTLGPDLDSDIVFLVNHSLLVADGISGVYHQLIITSCHRILQLKHRLFQLYSEKASMVCVRYEYDHVCETVLDEVCDLEEHVCLAVTQLIIEGFVCPLEPLAWIDMVTAGHQTCRDENLKQIVIDFAEHTDKLCHKSLLVASISPDSHTRQQLLTAVTNLKVILTDLVPLTFTWCQDPAAKKHLDLLLDQWVQEVGSILDAVDSLLGTDTFINMSANILSREVELMNTCPDWPLEDFQKHFRWLVYLAERPGIVAAKVMDESSDPIYRNGLLYFINNLYQGIADARDVYQEVVQTWSPPKQQLDTLHKRLKLVVQAVRSLGHALDGHGHPPLLSDKRRVFSGPSLHAGRVCVFL